MIEKISFAVRIAEDDEIDMEAFDQSAKEKGIGREELVRSLMRAYLTRLSSEEQYYTIKGYSNDHKRYADLHCMDGDVNWHTRGIEYDTEEWRILEHAVDVAQRGDPGDKEEAVKLFQQLFGERNVFLKNLE